ncbi:MAG: BrnA antitoxin family protein [Neisseria sp.]|nr:BrnA antitoxin family protein [Neisseria sp.]
MNGCKTDILKVMEAVKSLPPEQDYVWDGKDEDDRPASREELSAAIRRGRPKAAQTKEQVTLRLSPDVLAAFRKDGKGWQTRINEALRQYLAMQ